MHASYDFSPSSARASESKAETLDWFLSLKRISTGLSLISLTLGFWVFAMLIFINRHQAELNGLSGGDSVAMVGGIGASLVGTVFLVAGCLHCMRLTNYTVDDLI